MRYCFFVLVLLQCSCVSSIHLSQTRDEPKPIPQLSAGAKHILLLNTFDTRKHKFRENKKELYDKFIDGVLSITDTYLKNRHGVSTTLLDSLNDVYSQDSALYHLMIKHNATHAIVLNSFNVDFQQTEVETTRSPSGGKSKEAFYDIVSDMEFSVYEKDSLIDKQSVLSRQNHSSRPVVSGLLAAGPNVVVQRKDAWMITERNLKNYLSYFSKMMRE
ncbi:MAG TPA: hypothetical protein VF622_11375 [Segetibacter sp.]|jgi:hypothetical protein